MLKRLVFVPVAVLAVAAAAGAQPPIRQKQAQAAAVLAEINTIDVQGDSATVNYFSKLSAPAFAAWVARGLTSVAQTLNPANTACASYNSNITDPGVLPFVPSL